MDIVRRMNLDLQPLSCANGRTAKTREQGNVMRGTRVYTCAPFRNLCVELLRENFLHKSTRDSGVASKWGMGSLSKCTSVLLAVANRDSLIPSTKIIYLLS